MSIDWKDVWANAVQAAEDAVRAKAPAATKFVKGIAAAREQRLKLLLAALADGALDEQTIEEELQEERSILEMEFLAVQVMVKKAAQDAANALIGTIEKALLKGIDLVI
jgi:superfamily I DNA and RNA helicase